MATRIVMPKLMMTVSEGTITRWVKGQGEKVEKGETLMTIMTEKIEYEMQAPESGIVHVVVPEGVTVPYGRTVGWLLATGEAVPDVGEEAVVRMSSVVDEVAQTESLMKKPQPSAAPAAAAPAPAPAPAAPAGPVKASPAAKRLASELGVDLSRVKGTGPDGRIVEDDIKKAAEASQAAPAPAPAASKPAPAASAPAAPAAAPAAPPKVAKFAGVRKIIADRMMASIHGSAQLTNAVEINVTDLVKLRNQLVEEWKDKGVRPTYTDIIIKASARALGEYPRVNANVIGDEIHYRQDINVGMATALPDGLIVPLIHNTDKKSLLEIAKLTKVQAEKARNNKLSGEDITGGTFTVSSLGMYGTDVFTPIINQPEVAILGVGRIVEKPVIFNGDICKRSMMWLSLTYDHRVVDGAVAAEFLRRMKDLLEKPHLIFI
ncbi:MAG: dihydrolipoamide acetyltransferase family protein [Dehalococcoidia bacterium]|nr:dihydrolipoamide acetyltransferase family protein [Dehalococcoidia bacterium]